jgi:H+-transporting ATPase
MRNYAIYRIACTIQLLMFFFLSIVSLNLSSIYHDGDQSIQVDGHPLGSITSQVYNTSIHSSLDGQLCSQKYSALKDITNDGSGQIDMACALPLLTLHGAVFVLPVISIVVITILNDGTIITIAYDKVIPDKKPQRWDLRQVSVAATVLGLVACAGSMLLLFWCMQANYANHAYDLYMANPDNFQNIKFLQASGAGWFGKLVDPNRPFFTFGEVQTIMYLKISISDFLTVFAARTRGFFFERRPGYALATALIVATGTSTIFSLTASLHDAAPTSWNAAGVMQALGSRPMAVLATWIFCLIFFFIQDLIKIVTYAIWDRLYPEHEERLEDLTRKNTAGRALANYDRASRRHGGLHREVSMAREIAYMNEAAALSQAGGTQQLLDRIAALEKIVADLKK